MNRFLAAFLFLLLAMPLWAAHVAFTNSDFTTAPQAVRRLELYPVGAPFTNGGVIITRDRVGRANNTNGWMIISNIIGGTYRGEFQGTFASTTNWFLFPVTNGIINASDWIVSPTNWPGGVGYTMNQADGRFVRSDNGAGTNNIFRGTVTFPGSGINGYVWTATNATGAGYWSPGGASGSATNIFLSSGAYPGIAIDTNSSGNWTLRFQTNTLPIISLSARGIRNGLSSLTNDGGRFGPDTPGTVTMGIQEALSSIQQIGIGTNTVGATLQFGPGDFFYTNALYYSNGSVSHVKLQGAGFLASRLIYAGNTSTNLMTFTGRPDSGGGTLHFEARDLTFTSITNGNSIFLRYTNNAFGSVEYCNFTGWQITTNTDWGASVSIPGLPADPQGGVGIVFGTSLSHAEFIRNCFFAGLATAIVPYGDHFYAENVKFADIGMYGPGASEGTAWPNTSIYSLGAAYLRPVAGLNTDVFRTHLYQCNGGFVYLTAGGAHLTEVQLETCDHPFAVVSGAAGTFYMDVGANASTGGPFDSSQRFSLTTSPYAYGSANNANIIVYAALSSTLYQGTVVNANGSITTNWGFLQSDKINVGQMTSTNIAGVRNTNDMAVFGQVGTNLIYISGAGTANANGLYRFKIDIGGPPNHFIIWTNENGLYGIINDPGLHVYANEWSITNNAAAPAYVYTAGAGGDGTPINPWTSAGGSGSGSATSVNGTNYYTNNFVAYYNLDGTAPASVAWGTNILFVNRASPFASDTNATPGNADRPWQSVSNALASAQSNQIVFVYPGYYTNAPDNLGLTIPNNVTLMGWSPQSVRIGGQADAEPATTLKTNASVVGISGYMTLVLGSPGATVQSVQATGQIDCLLVSGPATNILIKDSSFAVIGSDTSPILDAGVITAYKSNTISIVNSVFESRKQSAHSGANDYRRALVVKSGIVDIRGGKLIARDSMNSLGLASTGDVGANSAFVNFSPDLVFDVGTTNVGGLAFGITNSTTNPGVITSSGTLPIPITQLSGGIKFSNAYAFSNLFGPYTAPNFVSTSALYVDTAKMTDVGDGRVAFETGLVTPKGTFNNATASRLAMFDANKVLTNVNDLAGLALVNGTLTTNFSLAALGGGDVTQAGQNNFSGSNFFQGITTFSNSVVVGTNQIHSTNIFQVAGTNNRQAFEINRDGRIWINTNVYQRGNFTNDGTMQAATFVATGTGPSVFNNSYGMSNNGTASFAGNITNTVLTASKVVMTDANKALSSVSSGAVPIDGDGTATTAAQVNTLFPSFLWTNGLTQASFIAAAVAWTGSNWWSGAINYATNQSQIRPDFNIPFQLMSTNAAFTFLAPNNVDTGVKKSVQTCAIYVTNTTAAAVLVTAPANCHPVPATGMYVTNLSRFTFEYYPNGFTNCFCTPVF